MTEAQWCLGTSIDKVSRWTRVPDCLADRQGQQVIGTTACRPHLTSTSCSMSYADTISSQNRLAEPSGLNGPNQLRLRVWKRRYLRNAAKIQARSASKWVCRRLILQHSARCAASRKNFLAEPQNKQLHDSNNQFELHCFSLTPAVSARGESRDSDCESWGQSGCDRPNDRATRDRSSSRHV